MKALKPFGIKGLSVAASAALMIALLLSSPPRVSGAAFMEWTIPPTGTTPYGIAATSGLPSIWFVEYGTSRLGRLDPTTGEIKEYQLPSTGRPWDIKLDTDPSGNFRSAWISFSEAIDTKYYVAKYDGSDLHMFQIPSPCERPHGLWLERDPTTSQLDVKYVWIAFGNGYIGRIDPVNPQAGATWSFSYWQLPGLGTPTDPSAAPLSIIFVPMYGGVFYTDPGRDKIGFLNPYPKATLVEWPTIASGSDPYGIAVDKDGNIWFTESGSTDGRSRIGKLNPMTNVLTEYRIPSDNAEPRGILVDNVDEMGRKLSDKTGIWIAEHRTNKIAKFDPEGNTFVEFTRPVSGAPHGLAMDLTPSRRIWYSDEGGARIGRIDPSIAIAATSTNFISTATTSITTETANAGATTSTTISRTSATTVAVISGVSAITSTWTSTTASTYYELTETSQVLVGTTYATVTGTSTSTRSTTVPATSTETSTVAPTTSTALVSATTTTYASTTTMTIPATFTSTVVSQTTTSTTLTTTSTQTVTTTATYITAAAGVPGAPAIPGFPIESIAAGILAGLSALALIGRGRRRRS